MKEMMIDLETKDVIPSAQILSVGAVVWETVEVEHDDHPRLSYEVVERLYRKPEIEEQKEFGRTYSMSTLKWWKEQDRDAYDEAWSKHDRQPIENVWRDLMLLASAHGVTRFWASPVTFDIPILNDFQGMFGLIPIWAYNQTFDVRTLVNETNVSARDHVPYHPIAGKPHMPVTDCEWQISILTAARQKLQKRVVHVGQATA